MSGKSGMSGIEKILASEEMGNDVPALPKVQPMYASSGSIINKGGNYKNCNGECEGCPSHNC
jgi:hypothetical protein